MSENMQGIWIGENSAVAVTEVMTIAFLRLEEDLIASILRYDKMGTVSVTYGHGNSCINKKHTHTAAVIFDGDKTYKNNDEASDFIELHSSDKISFDEQKNVLIYMTYDNRIFENTLAEKIGRDYFKHKNDADEPSSVSEKMALWNIWTEFKLSEKKIYADIDTQKYSIFYTIDLNGNQYDENYKEFIYCRVGQKGYCEKGHAMLPTVQIRHHHTSMLENNLLSLNDYIPNEAWFVEDSCSFPGDGGWYWAVKKITGDVIYLQGCGGDIYQIHKK